MFGIATINNNNNKYYERGNKKPLRIDTERLWNAGL
jgi:hypothetical protein